MECSIFIFMCNNTLVDTKWGDITLKPSATHFYWWWHQTHPIPQNNTRNLRDRTLRPRATMSRFESLTPRKQWPKLPYHLPETHPEAREGLSVWPLDIVPMLSLSLVFPPRRLRGLRWKTLDSWSQRPSGPRQASSDCVYIGHWTMTIWIGFVENLRSFHRREPW
jgi:hypothetical protein